MTPEDLAEMSRRLDEEFLLRRYGFEPVLQSGRELWVHGPKTGHPPSCGPASRRPAGSGR